MRLGRRGRWAVAVDNKTKHPVCGAIVCPLVFDADCVLDRALSTPPVDLPPTTASVSRTARDLETPYLQAIDP